MRVFVTLVVAAMLVGCAPQPAPQVTPTPEPVELVDVPAPAQVFGGDCSAMFSDAALNDALGQPLTASLWPEPVTPEGHLVDQVGGISCSWSEPTGSPDTFSSPVLLVVAVPAAAVSVPEDTECIPTDLSNTSCPVDVTVNGIRLSGIVTSDAEGADAQARVTAVQALFATSAGATAAPPAPTPLEGAWQNPADCPALAESVDLAAIFDTDDYQADDALGTDVYASAVDRELWGPRSVPGCHIYSMSGPPVSFAALGGGAWTRDAVLALERATVVDVPGFDLVVERTTDGVTVIDIFEGVNWLQSSTDDPEALYPALAAIVAALNADV